MAADLGACLCFQDESGPGSARRSAALPRLPRCPAPLTAVVTSVGSAGHTSLS